MFAVYLNLFNQSKPTAVLLSGDFFNGQYLILMKVIHFEPLISSVISVEIRCQDGPLSINEHFDPMGMLVTVRKLHKARGVSFRRPQGIEVAITRQREIVIAEWMIQECFYKLDLAYKNKNGKNFVAWLGIVRRDASIVLGGGLLIDCRFLGYCGLSRFVIGSDGGMWAFLEIIGGSRGLLRTHFGCAFPVKTVFSFWKCQG